MSETQPPIHEAPNWGDFFPGPEDWEALQGGRPRVFKPIRNANRKWVVMHVYDEHPDFSHRFKSGIIVDTLPPKELKLSFKTIQRTNEEGNLIKRDIVIPAIMDRTIHGDVCEARSGALSSTGYPRVINQMQYEEHLDKLRHDGYEELIYRATVDGPRLAAQPIRPARPLV